MARKLAADPPTSSLEELRRHRIERVRKQNEGLSLDLAKKKGELVDATEFKKQVLEMNSVVKRQLLSLPYHLGQKLASSTDPRECGQILEAALVKALNSLAWENERLPNACPTCGKTLKTGGWDAA